MTKSHPTGLPRWILTAIVTTGISATPGAVNAEDKPAGAPSTIVFSGVALKEASRFGYLGSVSAFNHDLGTNGWLSRVFIGGGDYDYRTASVASGRVDADFYKGDIGIGYQHFLSRNWRISGYAMANYEEHDLSSADVTNRVTGGEWGAKVRAELATTDTSPIDFTLLADYSTAFRTYWADIRIGMKVHGNISIGPEVIAQGNRGFDEIWYGGYIMNVPNPLGFGTLGASMGWSDSLRSQGGASGSKDSMYGIVRSSVLF